MSIGWLARKTDESVSDVVGCGVVGNDAKISKTQVPQVEVVMLGTSGTDKLEVRSVELHMCSAFRCHEVSESTP